MVSKVQNYLLMIYQDLNVYKKAISNEGYFDLLENEKEHIFCFNNSINGVKAKIILFLNEAEIDKELLVEITKHLLR